MEKNITYWEAPIILPTFRVEDFLKKICDYFNTSMREIKSGTRKKPIPDVKKIIIYILRKRTKLTTHKIGSIIGLSHSSVVTHTKRVDELIEVDKKFKELINKFL